MRHYSLNDIQELGQKIGKSLSGGETIELVGDVGAGKTTLTKAIALGMQITDTIQSPTFTISNRYVSTSNLELVHYDFYRLQDAGIMNDELIESVGSKRSVVVIEWADIVEGVLPADRLQIRLAPVSESERTVVFEATGPLSRNFLERIL